MSDTIPVPPVPAPEPRQPLLLKEDSHNGESRALNISLRGWIALMIVATLCAIVFIIVCRIKDIEQVLPALKDLFMPVVMLVVTFYYATKPPAPPPPGGRAQAQ
jgi:hypothetical protein